jgi:tetratricopeptide (TPR) repeat protein
MSREDFILPGVLSAGGREQDVTAFTERDRGEDVKMRTWVLCFLIFIPVIPVLLTVTGCSPQGTGENDTLFNEGVKLSQQGNYDDAIQKYQEGLIKDPDNHAGYNLNSSPITGWHIKTWLHLFIIREEKKQRCRTSKRHWSFNRMIPRKRSCYGGLMKGRNNSLGK